MACYLNCSNGAGCNSVAIGSTSTPIDLVDVVPNSLVAMKVKDNSGSSIDEDNITILDSDHGKRLLEAAKKC